jgi:hypothetical protein
MTPVMRREALTYVERLIAKTKADLDAPRAGKLPVEEVAEVTLAGLRANGELLVLGELHRALETDTLAPPKLAAVEPPPAWFGKSLAAAMQLDGMAKVELESGSKTLPWVLRFAHEMEKKLALNRHKGDRGGWLNDSADSLFMRLRVEVEELAKALEPDGSSASAVFITGEAADVANFAMMIADVVGGLEPGAHRG